ncbi:MAG: hypothetical protein JSS22_19650 [Proteobacteria bacterium]|nr:hypothetical protein [Pseudomonadota bacterium]
MLKSSAIALLLIAATPAFAADPVGCDKFKWPMDQELAALTAPSLPKLAAGAEAPSPPTAVTVELRPIADAALPKPPERPQKPGTHAGFLRASAGAAGLYTVTISDYAWIDAIQNDSYLKPKGFSGVTGCAGARKSVRFDLAAGLVTIQISGVASDTINIALTPATP